VTWVVMCDPRGGRTRLKARKWRLEARAAKTLQGPGDRIFTVTPATQALENARTPKRAAAKAGGSWTVVSLVETAMDRAPTVYALLPNIGRRWEAS
jgi:hypothetical protein